MAVKNPPRDAARNARGPEFDRLPGSVNASSGLDRSAKIWFAASVLIGAVLAIILHAVVGSVVVVANELNFGVFGRTLGPEMVASIWALFAFAASAYVFYRYQTSIRGVGVWKGLRYGTAIGLIWLVGMLEGVALFGNPIHAEFLVGLSDAIPVLVMSVLLAVFVFGTDKAAIGQTARLRWAPALAAMTLVFLIGRYLSYLSGVIGSGHLDYPVATLLWTLLMGLSIAVAFLLLWDAVLESSTLWTATGFGVVIFGVNWFAFMVFIPLLFEGVFVDVMLRIALDIAFVVLGGYLALRLWLRNG